MIPQPDLIVRDALVRTVQAVRDDPLLLEEVFAGRPDDERAQIEAWFTEHPLPVRLGWPRGATELPGLFVTLSGLQEAEQPIGGTFEDEPSAETDPIVERLGVFFRTTVRAACWTLNADLTAWLQAVAQWGLLRERDVMTEDGLQAPFVLSATDLEPLPQWFPDFAFRRDLIQQASYPASYTLVVPRLREIDVTAVAEGPNQEPVVATVRRR